MQEHDEVSDQVMEVEKSVEGDDGHVAQVDDDGEAVREIEAVDKEIEQVKDQVIEEAKEYEKEEAIQEAHT